MDGNPRLCDFGMSSITRDIESVNASTPNHGCTLRYRAPELLDPENAAKSGKKKTTNGSDAYKSDVYSLSMVIVEARLFPKV